VSDTKFRDAVSSCKHDFGNALGIMDAKINKLEKNFPELAQHETFLQVRNCLTRFETALDKLAQALEEQDQ
jgi:septation ring formation regulator EzrA